MLDSARCQLANPATGRQPITPIIETVRGLLVGTPVGPGGWLALAWCAGLLVASYLTGLGTVPPPRRTLTRPVFDQTVDEPRRRDDGVAAVPEPAEFVDSSGTSRLT